MKVNHVSYEVHKEPVLFNLKSEIYNPLNFTKSKKINYQSNSFNYSNSNNNYLYYSYVLDDEKSLIKEIDSLEKKTEAATELMPCLELVFFGLFILCVLLEPSLKFGTQ